MKTRKVKDHPELPTEYQQKLLDWYGDRKVLQVWNDGYGTYYVVIQFEDKIYCPRLFKIGNDLHISIDSEHKVNCEEAFK